MPDRGRHSPPFDAAAALPRPPPPGRAGGGNGWGTARYTRRSVARPPGPSVRAGADAPTAHPRVRRRGAGGPGHHAADGLAGGRNHGDQRRLTDAFLREAAPGGRELELLAGESLLDGTRCGAIAATAAVRECTPSLSKMFSRCLRTVLGETQRSVAISEFSLPSPTS